jgi:uncharacterized protein (TIGR02246 family)
MQLTKLRAAPVRRAEVPPCAPAGETDGGTASQLIRSVRRTCRRKRKEVPVSRGAVSIAIVGLGLLAADAALGQGTVDAAIRARVKEYEAAYNAGDADAVAAIYAPDGSHTYVLGFTHRGRVEIAQGLKELLAGPLRGTRIAIKPEHIRAVTADVAVEEASFTLEGLKDSAGSPLPAATGLCLGVYQRQNFVWYASAVQCMVPPPMPQAK